MSAAAEVAEPALQELQLALRSTDDGFEAQVLASPLRGLPDQPLCLPYDQAELRAFWDDVWAHPHDEERWQEAGGRLFGALFQGAIGEAYERSSVLSDQRLRLRLVFRADDRLLSLVPWEGLWNAAERSFLGARRSMPLVRQIEGGNRRRREMAAELPLRVLPVVSAPLDQGKFPLDLGEPTLREGLEPLLTRGEAILLPSPRPTRDGLRAALVDLQPHVLHFLGHGTFEGDRGELLLETEERLTDLVHGEGFARLLQDVRSLRLVVLTSCETALFGAVPFLSLTAALAAYTEVPAMIAMQGALSFDAARIFTRTLYGRLAARDDVDVALSETRFTMARRSSQWLLPALFMSSSDGRLLPPRSESTADPASLSSSTATRGPALATRQQPLRLGVRSMGPFAPDLESTTDRHLSLLEHFDGRDIREPRLWHEEVYPRLAEFLLEAAAERRQLELYFAAHQTIAFAAGWVLQAKSGLDIGFLQGGRGGPPVPWGPRDGSAPGAGPLWLDAPDIAKDPQATDVAIALSLTNPIAPQVQEHLAAGTQVHRLISSEVAPRAGHQAVHGGEHALRLADDVAYRAMQRSPQERRGTLHLFAAAPNAFLFYLGQLARPFGRVQLHEFGFDDTQWPGQYVPSLVLPPPGD